jgi:hypothetical protein
MRILILLSALAITSSVSNQAVQTIQAKDYSMNCEQLQFELADLGADFDDGINGVGVV